MTYPSTTLCSGNPVHTFTKGSNANVSLKAFAAEDRQQDVLDYLIYNVVHKDGRCVSGTCV